MTVAANLLLGTLVFYCCGSAAQTIDPVVDVLGEWRIVKDVSPAGAISSLTDRDVRRMIGQRIHFAKDRFEFNEHKCQHPDYTHNTEVTAEYFYREWRVNSDEMPIGDRVLVIENRCGDNIVYPTSKDHLIIAEDGLFFEAVRAGINATASPETASANAARSTKNADIFGTWTIDGVTWEKGVEGSKRQAALFIGMPVYISASRFFYNKRTCRQPTFKRSRQSKSAYFHGDWRANRSMLPLPKTLTIVETECGTIYPIGKKRILIEDRSGLFFSAVPLGK